MNIFIHILTVKALEYKCLFIVFTKENILLRIFHICWTSVNDIWIICHVFIIMTVLYSSVGYIDSFLCNKPYKRHISMELFINGLVGYNFQLLSFQMNHLSKTNNNSQLKNVFFYFKKLLVTKYLAIFLHWLGHYFVRSPFASKWINKI